MDKLSKEIETYYTYRISEEERGLLVVIINQVVEQISNVDEVYGDKFKSMLDVLLED